MAPVIDPRGQSIWPHVSTVLTALRRELKHTQGATRVPTRQPRAAIHKCRKGGKRIRSLLALLEAAYGEDATLAERQMRKAARKLADLRDATARVQCLDRLIAVAPDKTEAKQLRALKHLMMTHASYGLFMNEVEAALTRFHGVLNRVQAEVAGWPKGAPDRNSIRKGLKVSYRLARRAHRAALVTPNADLIHIWRKAVQTHRHQMRLIARGRDGALAERVVLVDSLADHLGEDHDLHVLTEFVQSGALALTPEVRAAFDTAAKRELTRLRDAAFAAGGTLFWRKPKAFIALMDKVDVA